ncbi:MAG TPA: nucleotidyltransferase family protein [Acidimicrobiales bacterium]|nr:nucleotidyltransferase family protein [Acidimicrobiales bacterium]
MNGPGHRPVAAGPAGGVAAVRRWGGLAADPSRGVAAVVLAAGGGSRFVDHGTGHGAGHGHKLLRPFRGQPLAAWALGAALDAGFDEVLVVTGAADLGPVVDRMAADRRRRVTELRNDRWAEGQATSLQMALDRCAADGRQAAVVGLADQPLVPAEAWRAVAGCATAAVVVATYGGGRRNPVRLDRSVWPMLPVDGDEGARALMRRRPDLVGEVACPGDPADVDTVGDLERLDGKRLGEKRLGGEIGWTGRTPAERGEGRWS